MLKKSIRLLFLMVLPASLCGQGITVSEKGIIKSSGNIAITINNGDLINKGEVDFSSASLTFTGTTNSKISSTTDLNIYKLIISKGVSSSVAIFNNLNIASEILFRTGYLELDSFNIILAPEAIINGETNESSITAKNGGEIQITQPLNIPANVNPGNIGINISSTQNLGNVKIIRGHTAQLSKLKGQSIFRYFIISSSITTRLTAKLRFNYFDKELNNLKEADLQVYSSANAGLTWTRRGFTTRNAVDNYVELINLIPTAMFTLSTADIFKRETIPSPTEGNIKLQLFPNPVEADAVLSIKTPVESKGTLTIFNSEGKIMLEKAVSLGEGNNQINFSVRDFASGSYYARLYMNNAESYSIPFVKK